MQGRLLGWAGLQLREGSSCLVIDPLADAGAVWAAAGDRAQRVPLPPVVPAEPAGGADIALVTHLHRDHADAEALQTALGPGGRVVLPGGYGGGPFEEAGIAEASSELARSELTLQAVEPWETIELEPWRVTALPAVDGTGDPQVSWLVRAGGDVVVHAGDTLPHGWWWRIAERAGGPIDLAFLPINAPKVSFPHRQPPSPFPVVMDGASAAAATAQLKARRIVPIHYGAYHFPPVYVPDVAARETLELAAADREIDVFEPELGDWFEVDTAMPV